MKANMEEKKLAIPYNIQLFAEPANEPNEPANEPANEPNEPANEPANEPEVTIESLMSQIAELKVEGEKNKRALDKALREKGEITKQYRSVLDDAQKAKIDKETADEEQKQYVAGLEEFKKRALAKERYLMQGMTTEMADKAADAEVSGDMDALAKIQQQHTESVIKEKEMEWKESIPQPKFGTGEYSSMTKEEILAIKDGKERQKAIAQNLHLFQ